MARLWKEQFDWTKHRNRMWGDGCEPGGTRDEKLDPKWVYFVTTCEFTFEFHSVGQIAACLDYYSQKVHSSSRLPASAMGGADHWEVQRWFERLPQEMLQDQSGLKLSKRWNVPFRSSVPTHAADTARSQGESPLGTAGRGIW